MKRLDYLFYYILQYNKCKKNIFKTMSQTSLF